MRIDDISIFGEYEHKENRVTAALLQICKVGGEALIRYITNKAGISLPSSEIEIISQGKYPESVPDGILQSSFSFKLFVESKIKTNSININQFEKHKLQIKSVTDFLLYITPDETRPTGLESIAWLNWRDIISILNQYLETTQNEEKQLLEFLIKNFNTLLDNFDLMGYSWKLDNDNAIVLAGVTAEGEALKYGYYICQNKRSFRPSKYLAFYFNNQIRYLFEIISPPIDDVDLRTDTQFSLLLNQARPNYNGDLQRVFRIKLLQEIGPIVNDSIDKHGNPCPFTYGQPRYTTFSKLVTATKTSQLL